MKTTWIFESILKFTQSRTATNVGKIVKTNCSGKYELQFMKSNESKGAMDFRFAHWF